MMSDSHRNIILVIASVGLIYLVTSVNNGANDGSSNFVCGYTQSGLLDPKAYKLDLVVNRDWTEASFSGLKNAQDEALSITESDQGYIFSGDKRYREEGKPDELRYEKLYVFKKMTTPKRWNAYHFTNYETDPVVLYACREK
jgi:hypothetical protein